MGYIPLSRSGIYTHIHTYIFGYMDTHVQSKHMHALLADNMTQSVRVAEVLLQTQ